MASVLSPAGPSADPTPSPPQHRLTAAERTLFNRRHREKKKKRKREAAQRAAETEAVQRRAFGSAASANIPLPCRLPDDLAAGDGGALDPLRCLQLEHERRLQLEELLVARERQRIADRRALSLALAVPPKVACSATGYHLVKLPSSLMLAVPELFDMHVAMRLFNECFHRVPSPSKVC